MFQILRGLIPYILEKIFDIGIDQFTSHCLDSYNQKYLQNLDEEMRTFFAQRLQVNDYEQLDSFFTKNGIYSSSDLGYTPLLDQMVQELICDFYHENPDRVVSARRIEPLLRQALNQSFRILLEELSLGEKFLAQEGYIHTKIIQSDLNEIHNLLKQRLPSHQVLLPEQVEHFCEEDAP